MLLLLATRTAASNVGFFLTLHPAPPQQNILIEKQRSIFSRNAVDMERRTPRAVDPKLSKSRHVKIVDISEVLQERRHRECATTALRLDCRFGGSGSWTDKCSQTLVKEDFCAIAGNE